ncbi:hypothetical protein NWFMUON74_69040 [Nocardia wallacei]|uniref:Uncharacterized protein n=1 Tax=Nocardia wallacei TaxID=480035 RepID=A0A7G1KVM5_9NOCA|nr:hypothetical protein NWFMUON74_69040 [Nocardia wallacei]
MQSSFAAGRLIEQATSVGPERTAGSIEDDSPGALWKQAHVCGTQLPTVGDTEETEPFVTEQRADSFDVVRGVEKPNVFQQVTGLPVTRIGELCSGRCQCGPFLVRTWHAFRQ